MCVHSSPVNFDDKAWGCARRGKITRDCDKVCVFCRRASREKTTGLSVPGICCRRLNSRSSPWTTNLLEPGPSLSRLLSSKILSHALGWFPRRAFWYTRLEAQELSKLHACPLRFTKGRLPLHQSHVRSAHLSPGKTTDDTGPYSHLVSRHRVQKQAPGLFVEGW